MSFIHVRHPIPHDPVGQQFLVAGLASGHEGDVYYRVTDSNGSELTNGRTRAGAYSLRDFHDTVDLGENATDTASVTLEVFWLSPASPEEQPGGPEQDTVKIPLTLATVFFPDFVGWVPYEVKQGDTLTSIANEHFSETTPDYIFKCNKDQLDNPNEIYPGQVLRIPGNL